MTIERIAAELEAIAADLHQERTALNRFNPMELVGQAIRVLDDPRYGMGDRGHEVAQDLRRISRDIFEAWQNRER